MATQIFYIIPNPLYYPPNGSIFQAYMVEETEGLCVPCWHDWNKALVHLEQKFGKNSKFGVTSSNIEYLQEELATKPLSIKIKFMD